MNNKVNSATKNKLQKNTNMQCGKPYTRKIKKGSSNQEVVKECSNMVKETLATEEDMRNLMQGVLFPNHHIQQQTVDLSQPTSEKLKMPRERKRLLGEVRLPLNSSESKYVSIGLDPYENFMPVIKILKHGYDLGITFTRESFENFCKILPEILKYAAEDGIDDIVTLPDYQVSQEAKDMCRFSPLPTCRFKPDFTLFIMAPTLRNLAKMSEFIINKIDFLSKCRCNVKYLCSDVVNSAGQQDGGNYNFTDEMVEQILKQKYKDDHMLLELWYKFPKYVYQEIVNVLISTQYVS